MTRCQKEFHQDSEKASMKIVIHSDKKDGITDKSTKKDIEKHLIILNKMMITYKT